MAAREDHPGALAASYDIPAAWHEASKARAAASAAVVVTAGIAARHGVFIWHYASYRLLMVIWTLVFGFAAWTWLASWRHRPVTVTPAWQARLDRMHVVVTVPVLNEDPVLLDRCLWSLVNQSRPPQHIDVTEQARSAADYTVLRAHWERAWPGGPVITWQRIPQTGKKVAQAPTFTGHPAADVFVTVDSDTELERDALAEGLKPFADRAVQSVAGMELCANSRVNLLTRMVTARSLAFQAVACAAQSAAGGDVLVNRGPFALYRAQLVRDHLDAYLHERFLGRDVHLGDDAALTLFAQVAGKAVQQPSAFAYTRYPETLSHHLRQWTRWMRGSTIRNCWRIRYLPVTSFGWWFTIASLAGFVSSLAWPVVVAGLWPVSAGFLGDALAASAGWSLLIGLRTLSVRRSDESAWFRAGTVAAYVPAMLWTSLVLRPVRVWGICTCLRQGWNTRQAGAEQITAQVTA